MGEVMANVETRMASIVIPNKIKNAVKNSYKFEKLFHIK